MSDRQHDWSKADKALFTAVENLCVILENRGLRPRQGISQDGIINEFCLALAERSIKARTVRDNGAEATRGFRYWPRPLELAKALARESDSEGGVSQDQGACGFQFMRRGSGPELTWFGDWNALYERRGKSLDDNIRSVQKMLDDQAAMYRWDPDDFSRCHGLREFCEELGVPFSALTFLRPAEAVSA